MFHHLNISILGIGLKVSIKSDYIALRIYRCLFRCKFLSRIMTSPEITGWKVKMREIDWNKQEWMARFVSVKVKESDNFNTRKTWRQFSCLLGACLHQNTPTAKYQTFTFCCDLPHCAPLLGLGHQILSELNCSTYGQLVIGHQDIFSTFYLSFSHCSKCNILVQRKAEAPPLGDQLCDGGLHPGDDGPAWRAQWGEWFLILPLCTCHGWNWSNEFR